MKYDVFISYSRKDFDEVAALIETIRAEIPGLSIWFDITGIESGDEFEEKIISAIDNSSYVLFALSNNALESQWTKDEVIYAKNTDKKVIPILLKGASLKGWFLFKFGRVDCIDFSNDLQREKLLNNLSDWTGKSRSHGVKPSPKISDNSNSVRKSDDNPTKVPYVKNKYPRYIWLMIIAAIILVIGGLWIFNILPWSGQKPQHSHNNQHETVVVDGDISTSSASTTPSSNTGSGSDATSNSETTPGDSVLKVKSAFGTLSVLDNNSHDYAGASVYVDGKLAGKIPLTEIRLSSGSHRIRIIKEMYKSYTREVMISDDEHMRFVPEMVTDFITPDDHLRTIQVPTSTPVYGSLVISSTPEKARISINGEYIGETPEIIHNVIGQYIVTAEMDGYEKQSKKVEVAEGAEASLSFTLRKQDDTFNELLDRFIDKYSTVYENSVLKFMGVEYPMIFVEGGSFMMGSDDSDAFNTEKPVHKVTLSSYSIGKYEVTQELWEAVMGSNPSRFKGPRRPVEQVSWNDCQEFIRRLNSLTGMDFKLPTEAQWEYAARGGKKSRGYKYSGSNTIDNVGWYEGNSGSETHDVGTKSPNELGIYDMTGNVYEWCSDWCRIYDVSSQTDPTGPSYGSSRVYRGGSWLDDARCSRVSFRVTSRSVDINPHNNRYVTPVDGFRLCL